MKSEDDYNKFYNDIYFSNQNVYFEYKISDKLILNVLNFKKHDTKNIDNNNFSDINIYNDNLNNGRVYVDNNIYTDNLLANSPNFFYNNINLNNLPNTQLNEERQKIMRLEKELYLAKQKIKELEDKEEKTVAINFILSDEKINYTMKCMSNDIFSNIERIIYNEYPEYKTKNVIFVIKGNIINKNETLEKNGIKNGDSITLIY